MAVVPVPPTFTSAISSSSQMNQLRDAISFMLNPPIFRGVQSVAQTLTTGVWASITLDTETVDQANGAVAAQHDLATNNSRFICAYPGWYRTGGGVAFAGNATGRRGVRYAVNGSAVLSSTVLVQSGIATGITIPGTTELLSMTVGDYLEIQGFQESGGNLNTDGTIGSRLSAQWVSN